MTSDDADKSIEEGTGRGGLSRTSITARVIRAATTKPVLGLLVALMLLFAVGFLAAGVLILL